MQSPHKLRHSPSISIFLWIRFLGWLLKTSAHNISKSSIMLVVLNSQQKTRKIFSKENWSWVELFDLFSKAGKKRKMHPLIIWLELLEKAQVIKASIVVLCENKASPQKDPIPWLQSHPVSLLLVLAPEICSIQQWSKCWLGKSQYLMFGFQLGKQRTELMGYKFLCFKLKERN